MFNFGGGGALWVLLPLIIFSYLLNAVNTDACSCGDE